MKAVRHREPMPYWDARIGLRQRHVALQCLMAYVNQQSEHFTFTDRLSLLYDLADLINTEEGKKIVTSWYNDSLHTLTLIRLIAENAISHDDSLVSATYSSLNVELDRLMSQIITLHPLARQS